MWGSIFCWEFVGFAVEEVEGLVLGLDYLGDLVHLFFIFISFVYIILNLRSY